MEVHKLHARSLQHELCGVSHTYSCLALQSAFVETKSTLQMIDTWCCEPGAFAAGIIAALGTIAVKDRAREVSSSEAEGAGHFTNWSGTHEVRPKWLFEPETTEELESIVATAHQKGGFCTTTFLITSGKHLSIAESNTSSNKHGINEL